MSGKDIVIMIMTMIKLEIRLVVVSRKFYRPGGFMIDSIPFLAVIKLHSVIFDRVNMPHIFIR